MVWWCASRVKGATVKAALLLAPNLCLENVFEPVFNLLVGLVDFLIRQGAVVCLVGKSIRQALVPRGYALAAVKIE